MIGIIVASCNLGAAADMDPTARTLAESDELTIRCVEAGHTIEECRAAFPVGE